METNLKVRDLIVFNIDIPPIYSQIESIDVAVIYKILDSQAPLPKVYRSSIDPSVELYCTVCMKCSNCAGASLMQNKKTEHFRTGEIHVQVKVKQMQEKGIVMSIVQGMDKPQLLKKHIETREDAIESYGPSSRSVKRTLVYRRGK